MPAATDAVWIDVLPSMKNFGSELAKGAGAEAGKAGKDVGGKFGKAILAGVAVVGAGAAAATKALYNIGETFDDVSDTIRVGTGATGQALADLEQSAKNIGRTVPAEFTDIGTVVADLNTRLGLTGPTLETLSSQFLEAGRILGETVDVGTVTAAFNAFQIEGEATTGAMDRLFQVSQATGIGMNELAQQVQQNAPAVQALGFSFEDAAGMIGTLDKAGLNSSRMMAGLSRSLVNLAKDGEEPADAFRRTVDEIGAFLEAGDSAAAIDLAGKVFGTRNATQFIGAIESGTLALDDLASVAGMTEDTILGAGEETMDFAEQWQLFKNQVMVDLAPLAERVFTAISDGMEWIRTSGVPTVRDLARWLKENQSWLLPVAAGIGAVAAAIGTVVAAVKVWRTVTAAYIAVQAALNLVLSLNPIGIVILAIVGLVAALVTAYKTSDTFRAIVDKAWKSIKSVVGSVVNWFTGTAWPALRSAWDAAGAVVQWLWDKARAAWDGIKTGWSLMSAVIKTQWNTVAKPVFDTVVDVVTTVRDKFEDARTWVTKFIDKLKAIKLPGWISDLADMMGGIVDALSSGAGKVASFFGIGDAPADFRGVAIGGGKALARVQSVLPAGLSVTSTYRSPAHNARVGGSRTSLHMDRNNPAVDIGGPTHLLDRFAAQLAMMGGWRQLLWRVAGHYDHIHVAHSGGVVSSSWPRMPGDRPDERTARLQVGETVVPRGAMAMAGARQDSDWTGVAYNGPVYAVDPDAWARKQAMRVRDALAVSGAGRL